MKLIRKSDTHRTKNTQSGFSLIELIIVIVTIGVIAVIAIPNLLSARRAANEGSAISSLRVLHGAQATYQSSVGNGDFAGTNATTGDTAGLSALNSNGFIDAVLGSGMKGGYNFVGAISIAGAGQPATFFFSANPVSASGVTKSGTRRFCVTQQGSIGGEFTNLSTAYDAAGAAAAPPLQN